MALQGNCTHYFTVDTGEIENIEVIQPDGTTETVQQPLYEIQSNSFSNVYVCVSRVETQHFYTLDESYNVVKINILFIDYAGYESKSHKENNIEDTLFEGTEQIRDFNYDSNFYQLAYNKIKEIQGFENLTDI
jgi:hypothetical protein